MLLWTTGGSGVGVDGQCWEAPNGGSITLASSLVSDVTREAIEGFLALPKRGLEVGGILFGHASEESPSSVYVDGFEPVACEHRFGPSYTFSDRDRERLNMILAGLRQQDARIVGWYRSYTGRDMAMDDHDRELIRDHFGDCDLVYLLVRPVTTRECVVDVAFVKGDEAASAPAPVATETFASAEDVELAAEETIHFTEDDTAPETETTVVVEPPPFAEQPVFAQSASAFQSPVAASEPEVALADLEAAVIHPGGTSKWVWAAVSVAIAASLFSAFQWWQLSERVETLQAAAVLRPATPAAPVVAVPEPPSTAQIPPAPSSTSVEPKAVVAAQAIAEVEPQVPDGVRARINGRIEVPVKVDIDKSGRVTRAVSQGEGDGPYQFVAGSAVQAARKWRFRPAKASDGTAVASTKTLMFTVVGTAKTAASLR